MNANDYTGLVLWDSRTGCRFRVEGMGLFQVLDTFPDRVHYQCLDTGRKFHDTYDRLRELRAQYVTF